MQSTCVEHVEKVVGVSDPRVQQVAGLGRGQEREQRVLPAVLEREQESRGRGRVLLRPLGREGLTRETSSDVYPPAVPAA